MRILTKKIFREIWDSKFRSLSIILIVANTIMLLAGLRAAHPVFFNAYDLNMIESNVADGTFSFSEPIGEDNVTMIEEDIVFMNQNHISSIDGRIQLLSEVEFQGERFQAMVLGIDFPNEVNQLIIEQKDSDIVDENLILQSNSSCLIETHFVDVLRKDI